MCYLGQTRRGCSIYVNSSYLEADLRILTGLVESHFMAGASGGRKSVCPGLIGEESIHVFQGASMLASPNVGDLILSRVMKKRWVDVTLNSLFAVTGVFAGNFEAAHLEAVDHIKKYVSLPIDKEYDVIVTHAGYVGINHYQAAKAGVVAIPALKQGGRLIMTANNTDLDAVGSCTYRTLLHLLTLMGERKFNELLLSSHWSFLPDQWQVQMWSMLFKKIPPNNLIYYSPQLYKQDYQIIPGRDGNSFLPSKNRYTNLE